MPAERDGASNKLYLEADMDRAELVPFVDGLAAVRTAPSPDRETPNEDAAALLPGRDGRGVLIVADGVGGHAAGGEAARAAVQALVSALKDALDDPEQPLRPAVLDGVERANAAVLELGVGAATTLIVAELDDGAVRAYHVGDSVLLVTGQRGLIKHQTVAHSPVGYAMESGMIDEGEAMDHEDRHLVSNALGSPDMHITVGPKVPLSARDTLLLGTDGLFDNLSQREIIERMRKGPLDRAVRRLADDARRRMTDPKDGLPSKPDDLTCVVWRRLSPDRGGRADDSGVTSA